jgi:threonine aldolase
LGAQFCGWLEHDHWLNLARHANDMAQKLAQGIVNSNKTELVWPVSANELFVKLPKSLIKELRDQGAVFYEWPRNFVPADLQISENDEIVRMVTSFQTTDEEVERFVSLI